jgi:hypothetical protein
MDRRAFLAGTGAALFTAPLAAATLLPFSAERTLTRRITDPPEGPDFAGLSRHGPPWCPASTRIQGTKALGLKSKRAFSSGLVDAYLS